MSVTGAHAEALVPAATPPNPALDQVDGVAGRVDTWCEGVTCAGMTACRDDTAQDKR